MKISHEWLQDYLDASVSADEIQERMTELGFPVEDRETVSPTHGSGDTEWLDVEVTSNRGDVLSHTGVARELAAGTGRKLVMPDCSAPESAIGGDAVDAITSVTNQAADLCPLYTARVIRGVKVGPSPDWLARRLEAIGQPTINNVVDVTNFVLMELGQPLHAFDLNQLEGPNIVVRQAQKDEAITAIDNKQYKLRPDMLVIADASKPVAIAGVMGGKDSEVGESTADILLESAMFEPLSVRTTARALKLSSESSYRFERRVNAANVERASLRAARLIVELAGGQLAPGVIRVGIDAPAPRGVAMRVDRCNKLLGLKLSPQQMATYLQALGLQPAARINGETTIMCTIPAHRLDLEREVDIIEEVARLHGMDQIPMGEKVAIRVQPPQHSVAARRRMGQVLAAHGYHETITHSLILPKDAKPFVPEGRQAATIDEGMRRADSTLRPSLLPSLLTVRKANQDVGNAGIKLYEHAGQWDTDGKGQLAEHRRLALLADAADAQEAVRDMRSAFDALAQALADADVTVQPAQDHALASPAANVTVGGKTLGWFGQLNGKVLDHFGLQTPVLVAELDVAPLLQAYPPARSAGDLPRFPGIERDLSIVVDEAITWQQIESQVTSLDLPLIEELSYITTYRGKPIDKGSKSVSFRMRFRDPSRTLRHEEVDPQVESVVHKLKETLGAELRA